ncbi:co-chaperone DjlA [Endozoicomonas sp. G2_1]|uniref:co-chaperone DjlA n=1 Tax=Endozoicomonas sp. G2_1 TaxID=2821091 RepID=UPI001ADB0CB6|nr:co-chaperone DjlA [Endozoicomonas sp. G2_1]MBO9491099.1 co-chaperone DjlA [Endozoicomonas sp. G2_1]
MRIWGKVLGFLFGFMLSKTILGALLGLWLGHYFDRGQRLNLDSLNQHSDSDANRQAAFFYTTFSVMGYVAKANGRVTEHEIAFATAYMDKLGLKGDLRRQAQDAFREGKMAGFPLVERLKKFKRTCGGRHDLFLLFLEIQIQVAFADGKLSAEERDALHQIAKVLGFSSPDLDKLLEMIMAGAAFHGQSDSSSEQSTQRPSSKTQLDNAYRILGVERDASTKDVKKAYKKLMSQHHPDKLVAKGLPKEMMEVAKQKAQDIQAAYDLINKSTSH